MGQPATMNILSIVEHFLGPDATKKESKPKKVLDDIDEDMSNLEGA
jgi:hypothetical protein